MFLPKFFKLNSFSWFLPLTTGLLFTAFDILPSSCHTSLTTLNTYSWKVRKKGIVVMRPTLCFKFSKNIIKQKCLFSNSHLNFGPRTCHYRIHTPSLQNKIDVVENWCKTRLESKYREVSKRWRMVYFKNYDNKAWQNLQPIPIPQFHSLHILFWLYNSHVSAFPSETIPGL